MLAVDRTFVLIWRWAVTQSLGNQSPSLVALRGALAELPPPPAPRRDVPAPDHQDGLGSRASGAKQAGRGPRATRMDPRAPAGPAGATESDESALDLDMDAVAGAVGLDHEVALLRAAIRRLAAKKSVAPHVKTLAELRHQVEALCTALKTQHALDGRGDDLSADLARALEALGDELGVPR